MATENLLIAYNGTCFKFSQFTWHQPHLIIPMFPQYFIPYKNKYTVTYNMMCTFSFLLRVLAVTFRKMRSGSELVAQPALHWYVPGKMC